MTSVLRSLAIAGGLVALATTGVAAAPKAKPASSQLTIDNQRGVMLLALTIVSKGGKSTPIVLTKELAGGESIKVAFPKGGCVYSMTGTFDDGSGLEINTIDLCKDRTVNLVD